MNIIWLKKDLRLMDHQPIYQSLKNGPTACIFLFEPDWIQSPQSSTLHLDFAYESLKDLEVALKSKNIPIKYAMGSALQVFQQLHKNSPIQRIYSHQETGLDWTFQRDLAMKEWCKSASIQWLEYKQFAVVRKLKSRDTWNHRRNDLLAQSNTPPLSIQNTPPQRLVGECLEEAYQKALKLAPEKKVMVPEAQKGGFIEGHKLLDSFLYQRGKDYRSSMASPNTAFEACSRISPHITWGTLSLNTISKAIQQRRRSSDPYLQTNTWRNSLKSFENRLWWHCHFIQKLESQPSIEFRNVNPGFDGMRENDFNDEHFEAWKSGQTGYPMIDACMRALKHHGWINFRMRAMLISFASYQLWLHWKKTSNHLARYFVDFEPGIHYSQIQMQSGVTGINTIRMYSPLKQSQDQDPEGNFIKAYCPELEPLSVKDVHCPELVPPMLQTMTGVVVGRHYPAPIVDHRTAYNEAKQRIFQWRQRPDVRQAAKQVYQQLGSRKNSFFPSQHRTKVFGNLECSQNSKAKKGSS